MFGVLGQACFLSVHALRTKTDGAGSFLQLRCLLCPSLQLTMAPFRQIVHVLEKLGPSHYAGCGVGLHEIRASALRVSTNLFAHVHAHSSELVLKLTSMLEILSGTGSVHGA